jgi:hypothetical protein
VQQGGSGRKRPPMIQSSRPLAKARFRGSGSGPAG